MTIERYQVCVSTQPALSRALGVKQVDGPSSPAHTSYCDFFHPFQLDGGQVLSALTPLLQNLENWGLEGRRRWNLQSQDQNQCIPAPSSIQELEITPHRNEEHTDHPPSSSFLSSLAAQPPAAPDSDAWLRVRISFNLAWIPLYSVPHAELCGWLRA